MNDHYQSDLDDAEPDNARDAGIWRAIAWVLIATVVACVGLAIGVEIIKP